MIAWFARNSVAANLLLLAIVGAGLWSVADRIVLEVFPEAEVDVVQIRMAYRGATPAEVEEGIVVKIEEAIQDLVGIEEVTSSASEGSGAVSIEVEKGADPREVLDDVKNRVDSISTFPVDAERPIYSLSIRRREVIGIAISGRLDERSLRELGERVRDDLTLLPEVSQVSLTEIRPYEIAIEVSERTLQEYGLTFDEVVQAISRSSLDVPAGSLRTEGGEIRLRTKGQSYVGADFADLIVVRRPDGTQVRLGDLATIEDGFEEERLEALFNGEPCVLLEVYRVGDQNAIAVAEAVKTYVSQAAARMPPGVEIRTWRDRSVLIEKRLRTMLKNALQGGVLVLLVLGLFLRPSVAGWVSLGIPVGILGALAILPLTGTTVNTMSVFAFILVLGIVVDDAIVTGESVYTRLRRGEEPTQAAIDGTKDVAVPVTFGVLTTVVAFLPLAFMEGRRATMFAQIPAVVIPVLLISLVESKLVLPAHLKHVRIPRAGSGGPVARVQGFVADQLEALARVVYRPLLSGALWAKYLTLSLFVLALAVVAARVAGGHVRFVYFPRVQSEVARASLQMPEGTSFDVTAEYVRRMSDAAREIRDEYVDPETGESVIRDILATSGSEGGSGGRSNVGRVMFEIEPPESRSLDVSSTEIVEAWRKKIGPLPGAREVSYRAEIGRGGSPIHVQLQGQDLEAMRRVSEKVKARLAEYPGVFDVTDSFQEGREEIRLSLRPEAEALGLSLEDLARQVRQGFFGAQVQRIQRGRDDVRVTVRYPRQERDSVGHLESMFVRTRSGTAIPFSEVAVIEPAVGFATITRIDRRRILDVTADLDKETVDAVALQADLTAYLDEAIAAEPGLRYELKGEAEEQRDSFASLSYGLIGVLLAIYVLLAIPFKSYLQPLIVMAVIPFGWGGAVLGHSVLGMGLSIFSALGLLALTGVVVNDSLVMVDYMNRRRAEGAPIADAVREAGVARFRAILLTSLTTFVGLVPIIFDKSTQAQFLIPMAVSLGFGVLFATSVTLFLVPIFYLVLDDAVRYARALKRALWDF